jgi:hypothetical protein
VDRGSVKNRISSDQDLLDIGSRPGWSWIFLDRVEFCFVVCGIFGLKGFAALLVIYAVSNDRLL